MFQKLQTRADDHDSDLDDAEKALIKVLFEFDKVRMQMESDKQIAASERRFAESNYENFTLRLENSLLKSAGQRALPSGFSSQDMPTETEARFSALENEIEKLKARVETLENTV